MHIAKGLEPYLKRIALRMRATRRGNRLAAPLDSARIQTVMVYRPERYGDMLATLSFLRAIKRAFPHWHVSVWTSPAGREVLEPEAIVDSIEIVTGRIGDRRTAKRRPSFDLVLDLVLRDSVLSLLACTSAARRGVLAGLGKEELQGYYDWARALEPSDEYALYRVLALRELLGPLDATAGAVLRYTRDERAWAGAILSDRPHPVILNLSAHDRHERSWPGEAWAELTDHLVRRLSLPVLINAIGAERDSALRLAARHPGRIFPLAPGATFRAVACLVSQAALFISPDTSLVHVAGPAGVPTVGLFPLRHEFRWTWIPPGDHVRIVHSDVPRSLRRIAQADVQAAVDELVASRPEFRLAGTSA